MPEPQDAPQSIPKHILPVIVIAQFCCTSLWFAGNAVMGDLLQTLSISAEDAEALGLITSAVQFGFISGTLLFALLAIADRFSPSKVFFVCAVIAALCNLGIIWDGHSLNTILFLRFMTGFLLAGIYPVGMKIASDYYAAGLGKSLGYLVGALVLGTAFPHFLQGFSASIPWQQVIVATTGLACLGGVMILVAVPDGPYRSAGQALDLSAIFKIFQKPAFRSAAFGYFGHMWELYSFWAFVPVMLLHYGDMHQGLELNVPILSFFIIGLGGLACVAGGYLSLSLGTKRTATVALLLSGCCCLVSPLLFLMQSQLLFIIFLLFWGLVVIADSPLFSTLVARHAPSQSKGTALTIVNCIGFAITIISIQLITLLLQVMNQQYVFMALALGPILGLVALTREKGD